MCFCFLIDVRVVICWCAAVTDIDVCVRVCARGTFSAL